MAKLQPIQALQRKSVRRQPLIEPLEDRQLMSLTVDVRLPGGGKAITATSAGQVINMEVWAIVKGTNTVTSDDSFQDVGGSFLSTSTSSPKLLGNMAADVVDPFTANGSSSGTEQDLDGDTDIDVGSNATNSTLNGFFFARADGPQHSTIIGAGNSQSFEVGTLTFTVGSLATGASTNVNFRLADLSAIIPGAIWHEDGVSETQHTGTVLVGTPVVITSSSTTTTDPNTVTLQAETATLAGGTVASTANAGYTGTGYADFGGSGSSTQWSVSRVAAGATQLVFRYANGGTTNRPMSIVVNGTTITTLNCAPTGSWTTWANTTVNANLIAGNNTIKATATTSVGGANVDSLTINKVTTSTTVTYQAESATLAGGTVKSSSNTGFTGTGYADFGSKNSTVTFSNVTRSAAGAVTLTFRYANGSTVNRPLSITVNGTVISTPTFAPTGSWTTWKTITVSVNLLSGTNSIKLTVTGTDGPNLDWMSVG